MTRVASLRLLGLVAAAVMATAAPAAAQDFKVITNSANPVADMTAAEIAKIFLKQSTKFPAGGAAAPVDQTKGAAIRATFSQAVLGRNVSAVETYWQQQIFSGKDSPPPSKASDDDVIAFVKGNPAAIGYVSAGASTAGVHVVSVK